RVTSHRAAAGRAQRLGEQVIGARAAFVRSQVIGLVEINAVDRAVGQELVDVDHVGGGDIGRLQLFWRERDVLHLGELVALDDFLPGHDLAAVRRDELLLYAAAVATVDLVEAHGGGRFGGRIELDRYGYQAESDRC